MTINDTTTPTRSRRPVRSRKAPARWWNRRRMVFIQPSPGDRPYQRSERAAAGALNVLMQESDLYRVGRMHYLERLARPRGVEPLTS